MSEISRSAPAAPKPATAPAAANRGPAGKATEERGDVFSALLSLVAETRAAPAGEASAGESGGPSDEAESDTQDPAKDGRDNPVAQLLGWADPRSSAGGAAPTRAAERAQATSQNNATLAAVDTDLVKAGRVNVDTTGLQPLATPQAIDPAALPVGANTATGSAVGTAASALGNAPDALASSSRRDAAQPGVTSANVTGMQTLANPEAINPAALPPGANPAAGRAVGAAASALGDVRDARTSGTRRDAKTNTNTATATATDTTVALRAPATTLQPLTNASARGMAAGGSDALRGRSATWANSTVSMDLNAAREADSVAGNAVSLTARLSAMLAGQAQADGAAPTPMLGATQDAGTHPAEAPSPADLLTSGEAAPEPEPAQLSHWSTQHLRHAHLRLGEGALDSVDIRLSMQGQDLSVDFRTDNADIRQSLAQQANQSLASLLERSGIALADVSVGAQQQQRQPQGQGSESQRGAGPAQLGRGAAGRVEADPSVAMRTLTAQPLRADGSRPLDLFV